MRRRVDRCKKKLTTKSPKKREGNRMARGGVALSAVRPGRQIHGVHLNTG